MIWPFVMIRGEGGAIKWWNVGVCLLLIGWCNRKKDIEWKVVETVHCVVR